MIRNGVQHSRLGVILVGLTFLLPACASLTLEQVDYAWPVESVLTVQENNTVSEGRHALTFNVAPLAQKEFQDPNALKGKQIRILRNTEGYYFITAPEFKHVYVMAPHAGELTLHSRLEVSQQGLRKPALNQRMPYVELLDGTSVRLLLTGDDILQPQDLRAEGR
jgi:hypothetical protein